ncbi:hypothetical protein NKI31_23815 [Mesorhizobium sp. M0659]|uniref:hypothetical protein n=1 Tax=Mesorhizobium sp. M0659 TaxID=2956980 RepID=UPI00333A6E79
MSRNIPEKRARQGGLGRPVLGVLLAGLVLALIAWGIAEIYGEQAKTPATQQNSRVPSPDTYSPNPGQTDPANSKADDVNGEPVDRNPKLDKDPTPRSSTGGDQPGTPPTQPASP